jgi:Na+/H+-dicarboxylate symporter
MLPAIAASIFLGAFTGGFFPEFASGTAIIGQIFLNLLMMVVVPLVFFSMTAGIANLGDIKEFGSIGRRSIFYYFLTMALSVAIGMILVLTLKPGVGVYHGELSPQAEYTVTGHDSGLVTLSAAPSVKGKAKGYYLKLTDQSLRAEIESIDGEKVRVRSWEVFGSSDSFRLSTDAGGLQVQVREGRIVALKAVPNERGRGIEITVPEPSSRAASEKKGFADAMAEVLTGKPSEGREGLIPRSIVNAMARMEILPIIFFAIIFGLALSSLGARAQKAVDVIAVCNDAVMRLVDWIMYFAPVGIFALVAERIGRAGGFEGFLPELAAIGRYAATVTGGLLIHGLIVLPLLLYFIGKRNPFRFLKDSAAPLLNAVSTASSSATLPLTIDAAERRHGLSKKVSGFVLPLGATINMDGTALYEAVAAIFIAQVYGIELDLAQQAAIFITSTLAAIGAAGIPEAGLVTMIIVLKAAGLPAEGIGIILSIDWLLDRLRTTINVWGDLVCAGVIDRLESVRADTEA